MSSHHHKQYLDSQVSNSIYEDDSMVPKYTRIEEGKGKRMAFRDDNRSFRGADTDRALDANPHQGFNEDITAPDHDLMTR